MNGQIARKPFLNPWRMAGWGSAALLLTIPALATQFTREVDWGAGDFLILGTAIGSVGLGIELAVRASRDSGYRAGTAVALLTGFLVTWSNLAVGIIGDEGHPANAMFFGVIAMAVAGAFMAKFRPAGLSRVMTATAIAQVAVPLIAIAIWSPPFTADLAKTLIFNGGFAGLWLAAAWLYRRANK